MWVSTIAEEQLSNEVIEKLLYSGLEDTGANADCIIVLGSVKAAEYRVPVAVKAFFNGRAPKMMLCGGTVRDFSGKQLSEAEHMKRKALELGIPEESIIVENNSQNTIENILYSLIALQRSMWLNRVKSVLLVTTSYHMRRSLQIAKYLFPAHIQIHPCPANDTTTNKDNWMNTEKGLTRAKSEAINIVRCVCNGVIPDFEI